LRFLKAWADINKAYSGHDGSLVKTNSRTGLAIAAELLYNYRGWKSDDKA